MGQLVDSARAAREGLIPSPGRARDAALEVAETEAGWSLARVITRATRERRRAPMTALGS
jgi:hypothetical protein